MNWVRIALIASVTLTCSVGVSADPGSRIENSVSDHVQRALQAEAQGVTEERNEQLQQALQADPNSKEANWLSGKLERQGRWIDFNAVHNELADEPTLTEYRERRDKAAVTMKGQLELANWCKNHRLFERERAHLIAALELSPTGEDPALCARLGLKLVDGNWVSEKELQDEKREQAATERNLRKWQPSVQKLSDRLEGLSDAARAQARHEIEALDKPEVIPALEVVLGEAELEKARLLVELLARFKTVKATRPLARIAVTSQWNVVRKEAAAKLSERPMGSYVPELLSSLRTPIEANMEFQTSLRRIRLIQHLTSETATTVQHYERQFSTTIRYPRVLGLVADPNSANSGRVQRAYELAELEASELIADVETRVEKENEAITARNERVCQALSEATGVQLPENPEAWWDWWREHNQLAQFSKSQQFQQVSSEQTYYVPSYTGRGDTLPASCLVAGTPIYTDRGMIEVEAVKPGDLVLSKNAASGELAYRAVLRTTTRAPEPIWKVTTDEGEIRGTGGHNFWLSGKGWTLFRDLKPTDRFHGVNGPVKIHAIVQEGTAPTYNLVVADFHTYFVGPGLVLSHDVTFARPIDATVPGMRAD